MVERATFSMKRGEKIAKFLCCRNFLDFPEVDFLAFLARENYFSHFRFSLAFCVSERRHLIYQVKVQRHGNTSQDGARSACRDRNGILERQGWVNSPQGSGTPNQ